MLCHVVTRRSHVTAQPLETLVTYLDAAYIYIDGEMDKVDR